MIELERLSMSYAIGDEEVRVLRDLDLLWLGGLTALLVSTL